MRLFLVLLLGVAFVATVSCDDEVNTLEELNSQEDDLDNELRAVDEQLTETDEVADAEEDEEADEFEERSVEDEVEEDEEEKSDDDADDVDEREVDDNVQANDEEEGDDDEESEEKRGHGFPFYGGYCRTRVYYAKPTGHGVRFKNAVRQVACASEGAKCYYGKCKTTYAFVHGWGYFSGSHRHRNVVGQKAVGCSCTRSYPYYPTGGHYKHHCRFTACASSCPAYRRQYYYDSNGCRQCRCKPAPCPLVKCPKCPYNRIEYYYSKGCRYCRCKPGPACAAVSCPKCSHGNRYYMVNGCRRCVCRPYGSGSHGCHKVSYPKCKYGYRYRWAYNGCLSSCSCRSKPYRPSHHYCPLVRCPTHCLFGSYIKRVGSCNKCSCYFV